MEVLYKLKANEINSNLMDTIKNLFGKKEITITITAESDETAYLLKSPANEKYLMESKAEEPSIRFTPEEFKEKASKL